MNIQEDLILEANLLIDEDIKFRQSDGSFIEVRANKNQGYDFGVWNAEANKYRLFIDDVGRLGVGTNAPFSLFTAINDDLNNSEFTASIINTSDVGKGLSVIAGSNMIPNTVFTSRLGSEAVTIWGSGKIRSVGGIDVSHTPSVEGTSKYAMTTNSVNRIAMLHLHQETGVNNEGGDFLLRTYADDGTKLHDALYVDRATGKVGIGKLSPQHTVDIAGDLNVEGAVLVNGSPINVGGENVTTLGELKDVMLNSLAPSQLLLWNGTAWVNGSISTDYIPEGNNLYYTDARTRQAISSISNELTYNQTTGAISLSSGYKIPLNSEFAESLKHIASATFDDGVLGFNFNTTDRAFDISLDGRYAKEQHTHDYDKYTAWELTAGSYTKHVTSGTAINIATDNTTKVTLNPVTSTLLLQGSAIMDAALFGKGLQFTSVGTAFAGTVDLSPILHYESAHVSPTVQSVGGIPAGTSYSQLANNSLSEIIDKMLFGTTSGTSYTTPEITIMFTKDGSEVYTVLPGTAIDSMYSLTVSTALGNYKNNVGTIQGTYADDTTEYVYNLYINGVLTDSQTALPTAEVSLNTNNYIVSTASVLKVELLIPARIVTVTLSDNSTMQMTLPAQVITDERSLIINAPSYYLNLASVADIPSTGGDFKTLAIASASLTSIAKTVTDLVYMLAVPKGKSLEIYDEGSLHIDYIVNEYFELSTTLTEIPAEDGSPLLYDVYILSNPVPYSNTNKFKIIYK